MTSTGLPAVTALDLIALITPMSFDKTDWILLTPPGAIAESHVDAVLPRPRP